MEIQGNIVEGVGGNGRNYFPSTMVKKIILLFQKHYYLRTRGHRIYVILYHITIYSYTIIQMCKYTV